MVTTEAELEAAADAAGAFNIEQLQQLLNDCPPSLQKTHFYSWLEGYIEGIEAPVSAQPSPMIAVLTIKNGNQCGKNKQIKNK